MKNSHNKQSGQVVILTVLFFLIISVAVIAAVVIPTSNQIKSVRDLGRAKQAYLIADATNEEALYRLNLGKTIPSTITLPCATTGLSVSAQVTDNGDTKTIITTGTNGTTVRYAQSTFSRSETTSIQYGMHAGAGGISLSGGSYVIGNVYTNGNITGDSSAPYITGSATAANPSTISLDQSNSYTDGTSPVSVVFANNASTQDIAQSFVVSDGTALSSIRVYIKKTGSPNDITLRIVNNSNGSPGTTVLGTATLSAGTVTTSFTYVNVPISGSLSLTPGTTYWMVLDASNSTSKYYTIAATNNTYANGVAKIGKWASSAGSNSWSATSPSTLDLYFSIYLGGSPSNISGSSQYNRILVGTSGTGNAWGNQINNASVAGTAYCQTETFIYNISGNTTKTCDTSRPDPETLSFPISDASITEWKDIASSGGTQSGNYSIGGGSRVSIGPKKITGTLTVSGGSVLTLNGPLWVTGAVFLEGGSQIKLSSSYDSSGGVIIADGRIFVSGGSYFTGSGSGSSMMIAISLSSCPTSGTCSGDGSGNAIDVEGGSGSVVLFAPNGTARAQGGSQAQSIVAKTIVLTGGSSVRYDTALSSYQITAGDSSGSDSWSVDSWGEVSQ